MGPDKHNTDRLSDDMYKDCEIISDSEDEDANDTVA